MLQLVMLQGMNYHYRNDIKIRCSIIPTLTFSDMSLEPNTYA